MPGRPTFIVIGAPKAGTTALYHYLDAHPEVYMAPVKEALFFRYPPEQHQDGVPDTLKKGAIRSLEAYLALFDGIQQEKAVGEASPQYLHNALAAANIKRTLPGVKIVAILRHPVDRAHSQYLMHVNAGRAPYRPFETFFKEALPHRDAWTAMPYDCYGLARSFYYQGLKRFYDLFPSAQIRVYRSDDLKADPGALLADLYGFLGVESSFRPDLSVPHNMGKGLPRNQAWHRLIVMKSGIKTGMKRLMPAPWRYRLRQWLMQNTHTTKQPLDPQVRDAFFDVYQDDVRQTQRLTGVDLSLWFPQGDTLPK